MPNYYSINSTRKRPQALDFAKFRHDTPFVTIQVKSGPDRCAEIAAAIQAETGIDEAMIGRWCAAFMRACAAMR
jgi:hypothetical protein